MSSTGCLSGTRLFFSKNRTKTIVNCNEFLAGALRNLDFEPAHCSSSDKNGNNTES